MSRPPRQTPRASQLDLEAREQAVRTFDRNLIVIAGAGSGKTSVLVERVINQVVAQDLPLDALAAITFTERAAREMRARIQAGLESLVRRVDAEADPADEADSGEAGRAYRYLIGVLPADEIRSRARRALGELPDASIGTLHAFCARILRAHPREAALEPDFAVGEGLAPTRLREELWERFLEGPAGPGGGQREAWRGVLSDLDLGEIQALAFALSSFRIADPRGAVTLPAAAAVLAPCLHELCGRIEETLPGEGAPSPGPESFLALGRDVLGTLLEEGLDRFRARLETARYRRVRGESGLLEGSPPQAKGRPEASALAKPLRRLLERLTRIDDGRLAAALELVLPFAEASREEACRRGLLSFDALLGLTRNLLRDHPNVRRKLARRLRLLLVDEFQDTDPVQYEILFLLAEDPRGKPARDAYRALLGAGRLFIVGDPKQSIYRFRRADIAAYQRAVEHVEACGGRRLVLSTNWRAVPELVRPLDGLFRALLQPTIELDRDVQPGYTSMVSGRESAANGSPREPRIEVWTVGPPGQKRRSEAARRLEAAAIAAWIDHEHREGGVPLADFALLLRALSQVHLYTQALRERGLGFAIASRRDLLGQPGVRDLYALIRATEDPSDAPATLGVLRSCLAAVTDDELLRFAASETSPWIYTELEPDPERFPRLADAYAFLRNWKGIAEQRPAPDLLLGLLHETPLLAIQASAHDGAQRVEGLRSFVETLVDACQQEPAARLGELLEALARTDAFQQGAAPGAGVSILSVHGAKGLEFPTVILPDLARQPGGGPGRAAPPVDLESIQEGALAVRTGAAHSASWVRHLWDEERHARAEERRLFYVACTRARERLIFVNAPRGRSTPGSWIELLEPWGYPAEGLGSDAPLAGDRAIRHRAITPAAAEPRGPAQRDGQDWPGIVARTRGIASDARARTGAGLRRPSGLSEEREAAAETEREDAPAGRGSGSDRPDLARATGIAVHEALERWDLRDAEGLVAEGLRAAGAAAGPEPALRAEVRSVIEAFLAGPLPDLLRSREILGRELPLLLRTDEGEIWSGVLDLLYREPEGQLVVADYKTDRRPDAAALASYRRQLEVYASAVARAFPDEAPPAREILWLRTGERLRLD